MYIEAAADHVMNRDVLVRVTHKHVQRMQAIQALVDQRVKVDGATKEALAARTLPLQVCRNSPRGASRGRRTANCPLFFREQCRDAKS